MWCCFSYLGKQNLSFPWRFLIRFCWRLCYDLCRMGLHNLSELLNSVIQQFWINDYEFYSFFGCFLLTSLGTWFCCLQILIDLSLLLNMSHLQGGRLFWLVSCCLGPAVKWWTLVAMPSPVCLAPDFGGCFCSGRRMHNKDKEIKHSLKGKKAKNGSAKKGPTKQCPNWNGRVDGILASTATGSVPRRVFSVTQPLALDHWALLWPGSVCHPAYLRCLLAWW